MFSVHSISRFALTLVACAIVAGNASADIDFSSSTPSFATIGGSWYIEADIGISADAADTTLVVRLEQERSSTVIWDTELELPVTDGANCYCKEGCAQQCTTIVDNFEKTGSCIIRGTCEPQGIDDCICNVITAPVFPISPQPGDVFIVTVDPDDDVTEFEESNNSSQTTF